MVKKKVLGTIVPKRRKLSEKHIQEIKTRIPNLEQEIVQELFDQFLLHKQWVNESPTFSQAVNKLRKYRKREQEVRQNLRSAINLLFEIRSDNTFRVARQRAVVYSLDHKNSLPDGPNPVDCTDENIDHLCDLITELANKLRDYAIRRTLDLGIEDFSNEAGTSGQNQKTAIQSLKTQAKKLLTVSGHQSEKELKKNTKVLVDIIKEAAREKVSKERLPVKKKNKKKQSDRET